MRTLIITSWLLLVASICSFAADTNQITLFTLHASGQVEEWRISESRVLATPEWIPGESIPLSPDKAWEIARDWSLAHGYSKPHLLGMLIQPVSTPITSVIIPSPCRFYYDITCSSPEHSRFAQVVVLMDGTVLEPHQVTDASASNLQDTNLTNLKVEY
jgi:hypothetical protein